MFAALFSDGFAAASLPAPAALPAPSSSQSVASSSQNTSSTTYVPAQLPSPSAVRYTQRYRVYPTMRGSDSVMGARLEREREASPNASYAHPYQPVMDDGIGNLPKPEELISGPKKLTLYDAIALALRDNPNVRIAELTRISDKFSLEIAIHNYGIQWNPLTFTSTIQNHTAPTWSAGEGISLTNTPSGTTFSLTHTNNLLGGLGSNALTLTQPLMKGFGFAFNRINYEDALDTEKIARLTFKNSVISQVVSVVNKYRSLVQQYDSLDEDKKSLAGQIQGLANTALQLKLGKVSQSDYIQQEQNIEATKLSVVQQEQTLRAAYLTFLSSLGIVPTTNVTIDSHISVGHEKVPTLKKCIRLAFNHNIGYRSALLQLNITKRTLISAENTRKWTLDLSSTVTLGSERGGQGEPIAQITPANPNLEFNLSIPIDNIANKQGVVNAKIAIDEARMNLTQTKENLVSTITNDYDSIHNQYEQIKISENSVDLEQKTLDNSKLKFTYGLSSMFEINTLETSLLSDQVSLIGTQISYLNAITQLYSDMGLTLEQYHIKLHY
ncbi:MAG: hypothetical protein A3E81_04205 [Gammaproteobacteria bacterium RIFCSPHIGHO2_12_FULL_36_30]|nr:MAG: hypothetical protein A3E81_04205 [Gammaproteobacteria bacterium RIFCSPHIGHO2_12_FULL_36_30]